MFDEKDKTLQGLCALTFWVNRVASAATDVAMGVSLNSNPVQELVDALERLRDQCDGWLREVDPSRPMTASNCGNAALQSQTKIPGRAHGDE